MIFKKGNTLSFFKTPVADMNLQKRNWVFLFYHFLLQIVAGRKVWVSKMVKKHQAGKVKTINIEKGLFFPKDFSKLSKDIVIYIEKGKLTKIR